MIRTRKQRDETLHTQAREAFSRHEIRKRSEGRWQLQRRYKDGNGWDSIYWTEIISLAGGGLYVGGDIDHVIFGHYGDTQDHEDKVRWMGMHSDFGYYVCQKATIGTGRKLIDVYEMDAAIDDVRGWLEDEKEGNPDDPEMAHKLEEVLEGPAPAFYESHHDLCQFLYEELGYNFMSERGDVGIVIAPRVHYAHAALARLCHLLDEERTVAPAGCAPLEAGA